MKVAITVNGKRYGGWTSATVTRGIDALSGSYELGVTDRWADQAQSWPILEGDACTVWIGDTQVITGFVDSREFTFDAQTHTASVRGRDRTADLVDCDATNREFRNMSHLEICRAIAAEYGVQVVASADVLAEVSTSLADPVVVDPGDQAGELLARVCRTAGVLPVADGRGGILLTRGAETRIPVDLEEGANIVAARARYSQEERFASYVVLGSRSGKTGKGAAARAVKGVASDPSARTGRRHIVRASQPVDTAAATRLAAWEASTRAARGDTVDVTVLGWQVPGTSDPWPINAIVRVRAPRLHLNGDMLVTRVTYELTASQGERTQLTLARPDAYRPEPMHLTKGADGVWRELRTGWSS